MFECYALSSSQINNGLFHCNCAHKREKKKKEWDGKLAYHQHHILNIKATFIQAGLAYP